MSLNRHVLGRTRNVSVFALPTTGRFFFAITLFLIAVVGSGVPCAQAVIVAGAHGGSDTSNNTTQAQLEAVAGVTDGSYFNNVFEFELGNAVYIGFANTPSGPVAYALSGMHLGSHASLTIQSVTYQITDTLSISGSDLALLTLTQVDDIMPQLEAISLASATPGNATPVVMIGAGRNRVQSATTDANTSDAVVVTNGSGYTTTASRLMRWGTNTTASFGPGPSNATTTASIGSRDTVIAQTVFDQPSNGQWLTTNEAQAVTNDSGGGVFSPDGTLLGIMVAVSGNFPTEAAFGQSTYFADIATYKGDIDAVTGGSLIPEPTSYLLLIMGGAVLLRRRHRFQ